MLVRGKGVLENKIKCGCVSENHGGKQAAFRHGGPAILQELEHFLFLPGQETKSSGSQLVEWEADTCMLQQIFIARMAAPDLTY